MNVKRFNAKTSREALALVRQAFGDEAVVLSTRQSGDGVEVLAMAPEGLGQIERAAAEAPLVKAPATAEPALAQDVQRDVEQLAMSTLSFQDYVRERMLKRRAAQRENAALDAAASSLAAVPAAQPTKTYTAPMRAAAADIPPMLREPQPQTLPHVDVPVLSEFAAAAPQREREQAMLDELRSMKGLIEERFGALAFMEKLQTSPQRATLTQKLFDAGFSPVLIRKLVEGLPASTPDEMAWASSVLERNLAAADGESALEDIGGVYALVGATGVGKTTTTAKIAAAFATKHGSGALGLVTLDAYRVGAQEQLRTYGRILGAPVHTAHDRASLEDLLELLAGKKMVLIDTAGMAQRDARTRELLEMLSHPSIKRLLVVNAAAQGETIDDVMISYRAAACRGVVLSKIDEAVKLGPALDAVIRHRLRVVGVANGQRVPEDWHRLSSTALVQRALRAPTSPSWKLDAAEVNLVFAGAPAAHRAAAYNA